MALSAGLVAVAVNAGLGTAVALGVAGVAWGVARVVRRQVQRAMGLSPTDPMPWPHVDWPRLAGFCAGSALAALIAMAFASGADLPEVARTLRLVVSVLVHCGLGTAVIGLCTGFAAKLPEDADPSLRTLLVTGGVLFGAAAISDLAIIVVVVAGLFAVIGLGSVKGAQQEAAAVLSDLAAGMRLRTRDPASRVLAMGGVEVRLGMVGLLSTQVDEGGQKRWMRNELALALTGDGIEEGDGEGSP